MRARVAVTVLSLGVLLSSVDRGFADGPLRNPRRLVSGRTVDLTSLFQWWGKRNGPRPLAAWVHLTGTIVGTNTFGWVIEGSVEKSRLRSSESGEPSSGAGNDEKVVLSNPPVGELVEFERLSAELKNLNAQRGQVAGQQKEVSSELKALHSSRVRSRWRAAEERQLQQTEGADKNELKLLDSRLQDLKKQMAVYTHGDHFVVDCFALDTGRRFTGMDVYEHGQIFK